MEEIDKKYLTGYTAFAKWEGKLKEAKKYYADKGINLKGNFFKGWDMAKNKYNTKEESNIK